MSELSIILASLGIAIGFILLTYLVGRAFPRQWLLNGPSPYLQTFLVGFAIDVCVLRIPARSEFPAEFGYGVLALLVVTGICQIGMAAATLSATQVFAALRRYTWLLLPGFVILFAPLVLSHGLTYQNLGPDYDGDLISASFLVDHQSFADLMTEFIASARSHHWWQFENTPYTHPDFRTVVADEFFIRSLRFGHAVLSMLLMRLFDQPLWMAFFALNVCAFIICPLVIADKAERQGLSIWMIFAIVTTVVGSATYVFFMYEGINVQMMAMPTMMFLTLNWRNLYLEPTTLGQKGLIALLISGMISFFGEGVQILGVFVVVAVNINHFIGKMSFSSTKEIAIGLLQLAALVVLVDPTFVCDFLLWTYGRMQEGFFGGILHYEWSMLSVMLSVPSAVVPPDAPLHLLITENQAMRYKEMLMLIGVALWLWKGRGKTSGAGDLLLIAITLMIFIGTGHTYAMWKVAVIFQPLLILTIVSLLPERVGPVRLVHAAGLYALIVFGWTLSLIQMYDEHSSPMHSEQFSVDRHLMDGQSMAILTPSQNHVYLRLAETGEDYNINGGWRRYDVQPDFSIGQLQKLPLAYYYDCDAEGAERCAAIKARTKGAIPERMVVPAGTTIANLLGADGFADRAKLNALVSQTFGVEARAYERPTD